ncbi:MAG: TonB-dependent receptor plug domain-containing protein [Myxococcales bacterium]|nr:TonB-dependent receptor plug domain-containing protein [Myxococcales bacterium]
MAGRAYADEAAVEGPAADEVIVIAGEVPRALGSPQQDLSAEEIRTLPGASNDAMRALASTPSVSRLPFSFGGLALRGASIRNTAVYVDEVAIPLPFHFGGITSIFPTYALETLTLHAGNAPVQFGRVLGGVVAIASRTPRPQRHRLGLDLSILHASMWAEGPVGPARKGPDVSHNSWRYLASARRSFLDLVLSPFVAETTPLPVYTDAQLLLSSGEDRRLGRLAPMALISRDETQSPDLALTLGFWRIALPWRLTAEQTELRATAWIGATDVRFLGDMTPDDRAKDVDVVRHVDEWGVRAQASRSTGFGEARLGLDATGGALSGTTREVGGAGLSLTPISWSHIGGWAAAAWHGTHGSLEPSLRVDRLGLIDETTISPRVNATLHLATDLELVAAAGRYVEPPLAADLGTSAPADGHQSSKAMQYSLGISALLYEGLTVTLAGYYHVTKHLPVVTDPTVFTSVSRNSFSPLVLEIVQQYLGEGTPRGSLGRGKAYGLETLLTYERGAQRLHVAYTWSRSKRTEDPALYEGFHPYVLDQPHRLHAVWQYATPRWIWGAGFHFATGIPYSPVTLSEDGVFTQDLWGRRVPNFMQLDLRAERRWRRAGGDWGVYLEIQNATARTNVESVRDAVRSADDPANATLTTTKITGLPFLPLLGATYTPR